MAVLRLDSETESSSIQHGIYNYLEHPVCLTPAREIGGRFFSGADNIEGEVTFLGEIYFRGRGSLFGREQFRGGNIFGRGYIFGGKINFRGYVYLWRR